MKTRLRPGLFWSGVCACLGIVLLLVALAPRTTGNSSGHPSRAADLSMPGAKVVLSQQCDRCHKIAGRGIELGPSLDHVGSRRTRDWLEGFLRNPRGLAPRTIMPSYGGLPADQFRDLIEYLAGLK